MKILQERKKRLKTRNHNVLLFHNNPLCCWRIIVIALCPVCSTFFSVTSGSIGMKLHSKHSLNVLSRNSSYSFYPCRILLSMATKLKQLWNSSSHKLVGRFSNNFVEMFRVSLRAMLRLIRVDTLRGIHNVGFLAVLLIFECLRFYFINP